MGRILCEAVAVGEVGSQNANFRASLLLKMWKNGRMEKKVVEVVNDVLRGADGYHQTHAKRLLRTVELLYKERPSGKLLELGTSGFIPAVCQKLFPDLEVICTHFDPGNVEPGHVKMAVGEIEVSPFCYKLDLEYETLPVPTEDIDVVLCCEVLEHMEIDPMFLVSEINRVLKYDGTLILTTPNITSSRALTKILSGYEPYFYMQYHKNRSYNRHNYEYSAPTLKRMLKYGGFNPVVWSEDLFEEGIPEVVEKVRSLGYPLPNVGDNLIAVADKVGKVLERYPDGLYV